MLEDKINIKEKELNQLKSDIKEFRSGNVVIKKGKIYLLDKLFLIQI